MKKTITLFSLVLCACSEPVKQLVLNIPDNTPIEVKQLLESNWNKTRLACPGLDKYTEALEFVKIDNNFNYADRPENQRAWAEYIIKENQNSTPGYILTGNHCFLEISRDGKTLSVDKGACKSLCMDKDLRGTDGALKVELK